MTASQGRLAGRIALITGASRGIGAAVAECFAREGAQLILVARTVGGLEETDDRVKKAGGAATLVPLDLRDAAKIDQMAHALAGRFGKLDILVGNAGVLGGLYPVPHMPPKIWDEVWSLNVNANWRLMRAFEAMLRVSDAGRVAFVTSAAAQWNRPFWGPYAATKAALESLAKTWAAETEETPLRINLFNPGAVRTTMRALAFPGEDRAALVTPEEIAPLLLPLVETGCTLHGQTVDAQPGR